LYSEAVSPVVTKEPFNMSFVGVLWRVVQPMITNYIAKQGDSTDSDVLSMSWEVAFNRFEIAVLPDGATSLSQALSVIAPDNSAFGAYEKMLRSNGGDGKDLAGHKLCRVIGADSTLLGFGIVAKPAAAVKGILPIKNAEDVAATASPSEPPVASILSELPESQRAIFQGQNDGFVLCDIAMQSGEIHSQIPVHNGRYIPRGIDVTQIVSVAICKKSEEKIITSTNASVTTHTANTMKIESIPQLEAALGKFESAAAVIDFVKAIQDGSTEYVTKLEAQENLVKNAEAARIENEKRAKELETSLAQVQKQLVEVRAAAEAAEAQQKHSERMAAFDAEFDLDDDDRKFLGSDIKDLDDASFAAYKAKCDKLMAAKKKGKPPAFLKKDDKDADDAKAAAAALIDAEKVKQALASVQPNGDKGAPPHSVTVKSTLTDEFAAAFGDSFKINGKSATELSK